MANKNTYKPWDAEVFFKRLAKANKLCKEKGFKCVTVSGLAGLEEALKRIQGTVNQIMVTDNAAGYMNLSNTPNLTKIRTVFISMRHQLDNMEARKQCIETIEEIFRQFSSVINMESVRLQENMQYIDPIIKLQEVDSYLVPGTAICMFELSVKSYINLEYNPDEWITETSN